MTRPSRPAKIVFILQELKFGGSQRQALELARGLDRRRFACELWTLMAGCDLAPQARAWDIPVRQLGGASYVWPPALVRLARALGRESPDLLLLITGIPNIWGRLLGRRAGGPIIVGTSRGSLEPQRQHERLLWRLAHHHVCNAPWLKEQLAGGYGVDPAKISVISNGVDSARFRPPAAEDSERPPLVLCLGRLSPEKGQDTLIQAFSLVAPRHPRAQLLLVGNGSQKDRLARLIRQNPAGQRIRLLPANQDVAPLLRRASVLALPSRHEGLPNVLLEAMATGLPVLASALPSLAPVVEAERTGLLLPPDDPTSWAAALDRLLADPALGRAWGRAACAAVMERYSLEAMASAYQDLFNRLLAQRRG